MNFWMLLQINRAIGQTAPLRLIALGKEDSADNAGADNNDDSYSSEEDDIKMGPFKNILNRGSNSSRGSSNSGSCSCSIVGSKSLKTAVAAILTPTEAQSKTMSNKMRGQARMWQKCPYWYLQPLHNLPASGTDLEILAM
jgi:hypothetical protein